MAMDYPSLRSISGFSWLGINLGIKDETLDFGVIASECECSAAGVFTRNNLPGAPVIVGKENIENGRLQAIVVNSKIANVATGKAGIEDAKNMCRWTASSLGISPEQVLPSSTGVIGKRLPIEKIQLGCESISKKLGSTTKHIENFARAIMTTDTMPKAISSQIKIDDSMINITGITKGSGMIKPNMATMLSFIATDANVTKEILDKIKQNSLFKSFNRITVDGDTSTNDSFVLIATCKSKLPLIDNQDSKAFAILENEITEVCKKLAQTIVRDGEGATKFISIQVDGGNKISECLSIAYKVAESPLVKTAFTASDPNWGRIIAAIGNAEISDLDTSKINIYINDVCIVGNGERSDTYTEEKGKKVMICDEIVLKIELNRGNYSEQIWTTDLSHEYIKINAEYRN